MSCSSRSKSDAAVCRTRTYTQANAPRGWGFQPPTLVSVSCMDNRIHFLVRISMENTTSTPVPTAQNRVLNFQPSGVA